MADMPEMTTTLGLTFNTDLSKAPFFVDGFDTFPKLWKFRCEELGPRIAHREKDLGIWSGYSWSDFYTASELLAMGLAKLGLKRGGVVSILSEDNKEWIYLDLAIQSLGAITNGVYTTDSSRQLSSLVTNSESSFLFVENDEQLDKYLAVADEMPGLSKVIVMDPEGLHDFDDPRVMFLDDLYEMGTAHQAANTNFFAEEIAKGQADDTSMLIYTSGTTGDPKGVELTQSNLIYAVASGAESNPSYATDEQLCYLPLCHIFERLTSVVQPIAVRSTVSFAESPETVFDNVQEVSPTVFIGVPRVWEKIYSRVSIMIGDATPLGRWCYNRAVGVGMKRADAGYTGATVSPLVNLEYQVWDFLLLRNLRRMLGFDKLRRANSGAAPISSDLLKWYRAIGVTIYEGFGMSESTAVACVNNAHKERLGTVGISVAGTEMRIGDGGELQFKGGGQFKGYWKNPKATADSFTDDGWVRTGDLGTIDEDGFISISGRMKDIIITAGGKNITPAELENRLKFSPFISDAVVIGDARKYLTCLVMIDQENVEKFAQDKRVPFSEFASLCAAPEVVALIKDVTNQVNKDFARVEQIKDFRIIDMLLTAEDDELTATMKLKRGFVEKKHNALINQMYV